LACAGPGQAGPGRAAPSLTRLPLLVSPWLPYDSASSPAALDADWVRASYRRRDGSAGSLFLRLAPDARACGEQADFCRAATVATTRTGRRAPRHRRRASPPFAASSLRRGVCAPRLLRRFERVAEQLRHVFDLHGSSQTIVELDHAGRPTGGDHVGSAVLNCPSLSLEYFRGGVVILQDIRAGTSCAAIRILHLDKFHARQGGEHLAMRFGHAGCSEMARGMVRHFAPASSARALVGRLLGL